MALNWLKGQLPDPPLIAAGGIGGPVIIYIVTPLRNALTLGAQDPGAGLLECYRRAFARGSGWSGGHYLALANVPGFLAIGPAYHLYNSLTGSASMALVLTAVSESTILFGAETRNAQIAYNRSAAQFGTSQIPLSLLRPWGPGFGMHVGRNVVAMSGMRIFSKPCEDALGILFPSMQSGARVTASLFTANVVTAVASTPVNQLYEFSVTMRLAQGLAAGKGQPITMMAYLRRQYLLPDGSLSRVAGRDVLLRIAYTSTLYTLFGLLERTCVSLWPR